MPRLPAEPSDPHSDLGRAVGQVLKAERERQGMSIYRLAKLADVNEQAIRFIENGDRIARLDTASRISRGLGLDLVEIISRARPDPP